MNPLGRVVPFPTEYDPGILHVVEVPALGDLQVELVCDEFTSLCPITGQPDFGTVKVCYEPSFTIVETKSLKLYLGSFRNHGMFQEQIVAQIRDDLVAKLKPKFLFVSAKFKSRGGISIEPYASYERS